jgi:hypothetical protein
LAAQFAVVSNPVGMPPSSLLVAVSYVTQL